jgi:cytochrome c biogenesis protein CcmG/thiol:disulfide interchange protein DsbE
VTPEDNTHELAPIPSHGAPARPPATRPSPSHKAPFFQSSRTRAAALALLLLATFFGALVAILLPGSAGGAGRLVGKVAPPISGQVLAPAGALPPAPREAYTLVVFFASWCPPCRTDQAALAAFSRTGPDRGVRVIEVAIEDTQRAVMAFLRSYFPDGLPSGYAVVLDNGSTALDYGVSGLPTIFLVRPDGKVAAVHYGPFTDARSIERFLGEATQRHVL